MNLVGKILTLLIFVMSITFMVMAVMVYQTHTNWRDVVMRQTAEAGKPKGLKFQLADANAEKQQLQAQLEKMQNELDAEKSAHESAVAKLESQVVEMRAEREAADKRIETLLNTAAESSAGVKAAHDTLKDMRGETTTIRGNIRQAQEDRDASLKRAIALADEVHQLETEQKRLAARSEDLVRDNDRMRDILRSTDVNPDGNPAEILPDVKGLVTAMPGKDLMEVSIGEDDGLQPGHYLEVYRIGGGVSTYLGRVEVVRTAPDKAVCKILPDYRKGAIKTGDRVASKLE